MVTTSNPKPAGEVVYTSWRNSDRVVHTPTRNNLHELHKPVGNGKVILRYKVLDDGSLLSVDGSGVSKNKYILLTGISYPEGVDERSAAVFALAKALAGIARRDSCAIETGSLLYFGEVLMSIPVRNYLRTTDPTQQ